MTKPAMHFNKLAKQRKRDHEALVERDKRLASLENNLAALVQQAVDEQKASAEAQFRVHNSIVDELAVEIQNLKQSNGELSVAFNQLKAEHEALRMVMEAERVVARENVNIIEKLEPEIAALEQSRKDLTRILDGVRDRMKRKELEAERAVLNRQVLAGGRPAFNRR